MPIHSLALTNVGPFRQRPDGVGAGRIELEFDSNVNLLIGPNNVGKSTILQALVSMTALYDDVRGGLPQAFKNAVGDFREDYGRAGAEAELVWTNSIGDYRRLWNVLVEFVDSSDFYETASLSIGGPAGLIDVEEFDRERLAREFGYVDYHNPLAPHTPQAYAIEGSNLPQRAEGEGNDPNVNEAINLSRTGTEFQRNLLRQIDQVILEITEGFRVGVDTDVFVNDPDSDYLQWREGQNKFTTMDGEVTYPELSHGTRSVFAWVTQFMLGMAQHYEGKPDWKSKNGIFIIDEIDAHLHPSWQRRIVSTLQHHFPNVQIFASTHSPMMVAGLKVGQVHLLKRDETGRVVWSRNDQNIIGWTADEIYRAFMGIDDPTDALTVERADRLRGLRDKGSRSEAEEAEMNILRRQVNEDVLAKGRINAQRERYAGLMEQFLRSRMGDLSQDGA